MSNPKGCACGAREAPPMVSPTLRGFTPMSQPPPDIPRLSGQQRSSMGMQPPSPPPEMTYSEDPISALNCSIMETPKDDEAQRKADQIKAERMKEKYEREKREAELNRWVSHLRQFDSFASAELKKRAEEEEDYPRLKVPQLKGHHRCRVSSLLNHQVDYAIDMEKDLRNVGIQETQMLDMLDKLVRGEAAVRFQGAVRAAEVAAMSAPPELAEEAAVAGARGYTVEVQEISKSSGGSGASGQNPIEIIGYIGCTRPANFK